MTEKNRVPVTIFGYHYTLRGSQSVEEIKSLATEVDRRMDEVSDHAPILTTTQVAILTALQLADELKKLQEEHDKGFQLSLIHTQK